jgi:DNA-binding NarL/FixJ family response regulator
MSDESKDSSPDELVHAIRSVHLGQVTVPAALARALFAPELSATLPPPTDLTERELDVLRAIARGLSNQETAEMLSLSTHTVRSHVRSILSKLNFSNRTQAAAYAIEMGLAKSGGS